jgi:hypothetical protein
MEGLIVIGVLLYLFSKDVFSQSPPPPKSVEEQLGEAITKYLGKGVKVRIEKDD